MYEFQEPEVVIAYSSSVSVVYSVGEIDALNFALANKGLCTNFICSVTCINERKKFWIESGKSSKNFILSLICFPSYIDKKFILIPL